MIKRWMVWLAALLSVVALSACAAQASESKIGSITVKGAWARAAMQMGGGAMANGAVYMVIENSGSSADRLLKADSSVAETVEIHETTMKDDMMSMSPVEAIEVPANGQVELKTGSYHVMLLGLKQDLKAGEKIHLTLTFEKAGVLEMDVDVRQP